MLITLGQPKLKVEPFIHMTNKTKSTFLKELNKRFGYNLDTKIVALNKKEIFLSFMPLVKPLTPIMDILHFYAGKLPIALGTGGTRDVTDQLIKALDIAQYVDVIITADDVKRGKPDPETFIKAAELLNVPAQYCQVFEDGELGLQAGKSAGMIVTDVRPILKVAVN